MRLIMRVHQTEFNPSTPFMLIGIDDVRHFGACLTPLPDSTLLVYKVVENHPLNLVPW